MPEILQEGHVTLVTPSVTQIWKHSTRQLSASSMLPSWSILSYVSMGLLGIRDGQRGSGHERMRSVTAPLQNLCQWSYLPGSYLAMSGERESLGLYPILNREPQSGTLTRVSPLCHFGYSGLQGKFAFW